MNYVTQKNWLENQLQQFKNFVPICPNDSLPKLLTEMHSIIIKIELIKEMRFNEMVKEVPFCLDTKDSQLNLNTI